MSKCHAFRRRHTALMSCFTSFRLTSGPRGRDRGSSWRFSLRFCTRRNVGRFDPVFVFRSGIIRAFSACFQLLPKDLGIASQCEKTLYNLPKHIFEEGDVICTT